MSNQPAAIQKPRRKKAAQAAERCLTVRMYDVGFGDCFLLLIPTAEGKTCKVLFDCGTIKAGPKHTSIKTVAKQVIKDAQGRIDVVIATHRHKDHVSGFDDPAWAEVEVGEVWMPWTENQEDDGARKIRELQLRLAEQLVTRINKVKDSPALDAAMRAQMESGLEMAINAMTNEGAMNTLYRGFKGQPQHRYLPEKDTSADWFTTPVLPGVTINVLGPSRDPRVITQLDPPAGEAYLKMNDPASEDADVSPGEFEAQGPLPFGRDWIVSKQDYDSAYNYLACEVPEKDRLVIRNASLGLESAVASALDQALNGTSLMLVFEIGSATLLFPGDAQWGSWHLAMENAKARKLLGAANFYKVGHHGSHNATPKEFVEKVMGKNVWAMVSVNPTSGWPLVPKEELLGSMRLKEGCKLVRSDTPDQAQALGFTLTDYDAIEVKIPF